MVLLIACSWSAVAQRDSTVSKRFTWFPILGVTPETSLIIGGGTFVRFNRSDSLTRLSFANANGSVTLNKQWQVNLGVNYFTVGEKYYLQAGLSYNDFPLYFYGIGNDINIEERELFSSNTFRFQFLLYKTITKKLFLGAGYRYGNVHRLDFQQNGILESLAPTGINGNYYSGAQLALLWDNRDSQLTPTRGYFINATGFIHRTFLGSEFSFNNYQLDARYYFKPSRKSKNVVALQVHGNFNNGDVPFTELAMLGGDNTMRGYYLGKYRDNHYITTQAEYRWTYNRWLGFVAFIGVGSVAPNLGAFTAANLLPNYGAGVRFKVIPSENVNLRLDYGFGRDTGNFYLAISEAF